LVKERCSKAPRHIITNYKKAYEELKSKAEANEKRLEEKEQLLQEYEKRLPKLKELTKLSRVTRACKIKYHIYSDSGFGQGARSRKKGQERRDEILESLARAFPNGQSNSELRQITCIPRWTVQRRCEVFKQDGLVYQDIGKFGKYHLTELALGAPNMQGYWLEKIVYDSLILRYTSPNSTIQEKLSALVVTLGIYNTYIMIQSALDEDLHPFIATKISGISIQKIYNILKSRQKLQRDNLVKTLIEGAIHPVQMFLQLCRVVIPKEKLNRYGSTTLDTPTTPSESIPSGSLFEENKTAFEVLKKAFADLYPEDFRQLEGIRKEQAPNAAWSHLKAKYKKQRKTASTSH
jgi:hypothetical protein